MKILCNDQRSPEWYQAKCGKIGASKIRDVMSKLKSGGEPAGRANLKAQLVAEMLTGAISENYVSPDMQWGIDTEMLARAAYEMKTGNDVRLTGFVQHPTIERAGASPDGILGKDGLLEIKCPRTTTHLEYLLGKTAPAEYVPQMQWQMACCERQYCDFVSYDPRMPRYLQLFIVRLPRDDKYIREMEQCVRGFLLEVDDVIARLPKAQEEDQMGITDDEVASVTQ